MATWANEMKKAALDAALALLNGGQFRLLNISSTELANLTLSTPAFSTAAAAASPYSAAANAIASDSTITPGDIALFELRNSSSQTRISGTVGVGTGDIQVASVTIPGTATSVSCSGLTISLQIS